jgi:diguanylate cyclase (GGDEF)-like protein/PAS domain S-box-containing protein
MAGTPTNSRVRVRCANGSYRWISATVRPLLDESGHLLGRVVGWRDAEAEATAEEALAASEEHFRLLAENTSDVIVKTDGAGTIAWVSPSSRMALGWAGYEVLGVSLSDLLHPDDLAQGCLQQVGAAGKGRCEVRVRTATGGWLWMSDAWHNLPATAEFAGGAIHSLRDIQSEREAREALQFLAYHDPLTRLATRTVANVRLGQLLGGDRRGAAAVAVLFVDIDRLKAVNDTLGHAAGDQAIQTTAQRLLRVARASDLVARFGGDEFLVLLTDVSCPDDVAAAAERIRRDAGQPMLVEGHEVKLTVSIGVALVTPGSDPEAALRLADAALYRAKRAGRDRFVLDGAPVPAQSSKSAVPNGYNFSTGA